jgi:4-alpha-glucanotransferase
MFAFHNDYLKSRDLPENFEARTVVYTGTHDNNTTRGWYAQDITAIEKKNILEYFGREIGLDEIHWVMIHEALASKANLAIIPLQDLLGLGSEARMNKPSTIKNNWEWRLMPGLLSDSLLEKLRRLTVANGR